MSEFDIYELDHAPWEAWDDDEDDDEFKDPREFGACVIRADDLNESFAVLLEEWSMDDYWPSWIGQLGKLVSGASCAFLITHYVDPQRADFIIGYSLYRENHVVRIQERPIWIDELTELFDVADPGKSMDPYSSHTEDGCRISEWTTTVESIARFLDRIQVRLAGSDR